LILQAQASGAKVIGLANAGGDTVNALKQAQQFGVMAGGQQVVALLAFISDVRSVGLQDAQGLVLSEAYYWDMSDATRGFARRFFARTQRMPTAEQAGDYSATLHYLNAIKAAGTDEAGAVMAKMRAMPVHDAFTDDGHLREDGRMVHDVYLVQVKKPAASTGPWDVYTVLETIAGRDAFRPLAEGGCPLVHPP
jgi:branched-chain amino acid transport system substrate-binding protein